MWTLVVVVVVAVFAFLVIWWFSQNPALNSSGANADLALMLSDPPVEPAMYPALQIAQAKNNTPYVKHTRKACKTVVPFTTLAGVKPTEAEYQIAIDACEQENLTGQSGFRCVGTFYDGTAWNSCVDLQLQRTNGMWLRKSAAATISVVPHKKSTLKAVPYLQRDDMGCKTTVSLDLPTATATDIDAAINACDAIAPDDIRGACIGVLFNQTWQRCTELQPDHDSGVWVKETPDTAVNY